MPGPPHHCSSWKVLQQSCASCTQSRQMWSTAVSKDMLSAVVALPHEMPVWHLKTCCRILWSGNLVPSLTRDVQPASDCSHLLLHTYCTTQPCSFTSTNNMLPVTNVFYFLGDECLCITNEEHAAPPYIFSSHACFCKAGMMDQQKSPPMKKTFDEGLAKPSCGQVTNA